MTQTVLVVPHFNESKLPTHFAFEIFVDQWLSASVRFFRPKQTINIDDIKKYLNQNLLQFSVFHRVTN